VASIYESLLVPGSNKRQVKLRYRTKDNYQICFKAKNAHSVATKLRIREPSEDCALIGLLTWASVMFLEAKDLIKFYVVTTQWCRSRKC
jgi:hypothetical protein